MSFLKNRPNHKLEAALLSLIGYLAKHGIHRQKAEPLLQGLSDTSKKHTISGVLDAANRTLGIGDHLFYKNVGAADNNNELMEELPDNAIITKAWYEVLTTFTDGADDSATIAIGIPTDDVAGIVAAVAISDGGNPWDAGNHDCIQDGTTAAFAEKTTASRAITATVADDALSDGVLVLHVEYVESF